MVHALGRPQHRQELLGSRTDLADRMLPTPQWSGAILLSEGCMILSVESWDTTSSETLRSRDREIVPEMKKSRRGLLLALVILNCMVLLGQLWPEGAPPFARTVNIVFLVGSLAYFVLAMVGGRKAD